MRWRSTNPGSSAGARFPGGPSAGRPAATRPSWARTGLGAARLPAILAVVALSAPMAIAEDWTQLKLDARRSGDAPDRTVTPPLGLVGAVPLSDAVLTAPVVVGDRVCAVDGSGTAFGIDRRTLAVVWKRETRGGRGNCNNVSSPAAVGGYLHFGTMSGSHVVLRLSDGDLVREIRCGQPIFASPIVASGRVYVATLGSTLYALEPDGRVVWTWNYLADRVGFRGDPFSGEDWLRHKGGRVTEADQFFCARDPALFGDTLVLPAGGSVVWLGDLGDRAEVRATYAPRTPTLGLSIGADGSVYRQWHRLDNGGSVEILRLIDAKVQRDQVPGTETSTRGGLLGFASVSLRGEDVYRSRPEEGLGLCRHSPGGRPTEPLGGYPSIASPILLRDHAVLGGLDGRLQVLPLRGKSEAWSFATAFGKAISAPAAVCDGRIYVGCEDGYLYVLGPGGEAPIPTSDLGLSGIRSPLPGGLGDQRRDWFTSFGDRGNSNVSKEPVKPPFRMRWIRRFEGSTKHFSTCGGGRLYTHTAEGQVFAVEEETGRLLWRRYFPGVHICYTSPLYHEGRLLVPQAGLELCRLRCLDAASGRLLWEAPFTGSPSWNRQSPPVVCGGLAIYAFSTGRYLPEGWLVGHGEIPGFPDDQRPLVRAFDVETGKESWTTDFSQQGRGGDDGGLCLVDGTLYYSCFFGYSRRGKESEPRATGVTAAMDPATGRVLWSTVEHAVHSGCTISGKDGRLYLGGYSKVDGAANRVWCLDARNGSLLWQSDPVERAIHVVTIGEKFLFTHAQYQNGYLLEKESGKVLCTLTGGYKCTRFTLAGPYLLGANMDVHDLSDTKEIRLVSTGPAVDPSQCVGAIASNGLLFYTAHGSGIQMSKAYGEDAARPSAPWEAP